MSITILKYPNNIEDEAFSTRRIVFMAIPGELSDVDKKWYRGQKSSEIDADKRTNEMDIRCMITLPIPSSLKDVQQHEWASESLLASAVELGAPIAKGIGKAVGSVTGIDVSNVSNAMNYLKSGYSASAHMLGARKRLPNPGQFQTYNASSLRSFDFTFTFIPESKEEAKNVIDIITTFKTFSSPSTDDTKLSLMSPFMWIISVTNGVINKLMNLKVCVCTNVDVTYGTDKFDIFEDGMPKKIDLSLSFSESELTYAENYNKGLETRSNEATTVLSASSGFSNSFIEASSDNVLNTEGGGFVDKGVKKAEDITNNIIDYYKNFSLDDLF